MKTLIILNLTCLLYCTCVSIGSTTADSKQLNKLKKKKEKSQENCIWTNAQTNETWKLYWKDNFDDKELNKKEWEVKQTWQMDTCLDEFNKNQNCELRQNVQIVDGFLVMSARAKQIGNFNYTGAKVNAIQGVMYGRVEFRLAQPEGDFIHTLISMDNKINFYWAESGEIGLVDYENGQDKVERGLSFGKDEQEHESRAMWFDNRTNVHKFHLYGIEWNATSLKFFFDDKYSEPITINSTKNLEDYQFVKLRIGFTDLLNPNLNNNFDWKSKWKCPAMVIDYVRVYCKVSEQDYLNLPKCPQNQKDKEFEEAKILKNICALALVPIETDESFWIKYKYIIIFFSITALLIIILLTYEIFLLIKRKRTKIIFDETFDKDYYDHYDYIYADREPEYESTKQRVSYLDVFDGEDEYVDWFVNRDSEYLIRKKSISSNELCKNCDFECYNGQCCKIIYCPIVKSKSILVLTTEDFC